MARNAVSDFMVSNPVKVGKDVTVTEVSMLMKEKSVSSVIIIHKNKPVGIVTERDLVRRVLAVGLDPTTTKAYTICTKPVVPILMYEEIDTAVEKMRKNLIHRLVVIDQYDGVVGILTTEDIGYNLPSISEDLAIKYLNLISTRKHHAF